MGAQLSCDLCGKTLCEQQDSVRECKGGNPEHICLVCFTPAKHKDYIERSVYSVVGEENARRMNDGLNNRDPEVEGEKHRERLDPFFEKTLWPLTRRSGLLSEWPLSQTKPGGRPLRDDDPNTRTPSQFSAMVGPL